LKLGWSFCFDLYVVFNIDWFCHLKKINLVLIVVYGWLFLGEGRLCFVYFMKDIIWRIFLLKLKIFWVHFHNAILGNLFTLKCNISFIYLSLSCILYVFAHHLEKNGGTLLGIFRSYVVLSLFIFEVMCFFFLSWF
jgi:hypothetical protein